MPHCCCVREMGCTRGLKEDSGNIRLTDILKEFVCHELTWRPFSHLLWRCFGSHDYNISLFCLVLRLKQLCLMVHIYSVDVLLYYFFLSTFFPADTAASPWFVIMKWPSICFFNGQQLTVTCYQCQIKPYGWAIEISGPPHKWFPNTFLILPANNGNKLL